MLKVEICAEFHRDCSKYKIRGEKKQMKIKIELRAIITDDQGKTVLKAISIADDLQCALLRANNKILTKYLRCRQK